ncbi:MAG: two-component system, OmpR family, sensor histidine kinase KdpD, partial [Planctomycetota bacterium]|nr:two-component system, OmpR family, sensor histidine kinase KdpD [Planctomycetota bacterium]
MQNKIVPYFMSITLVAITTFLGGLIRGAIEPTNIVIFYLLMVVLTAVWWGRCPAIITSLLSVLAFDYFLVPPYLTFVVSDVQYIFTFIGLLAVGLVVSALASKTRQQAMDAQGREERTAILYRLSKDLAASDSLESIMHTIRMSVGEIFDCRVAVFLPADHGIKPGSFDPGFPIDEHENTIAAWVFGNGKPAGWGTDILPAAKAHYLPLKTSQGVFGVLGIFFKHDKTGFDPGASDLLNALASQAAVAVQRAKLTEISRQMELIREREKLQTALLNSISHDLRTPLVSITGALSSLMQNFSSIDAETRKELLETAYEESVHLNRLVGNLLDMTR